MNFQTLQSTLLARMSMGTDDPAAVAAGDLVNEAIALVETAHPNGWPWLRHTATFTTSTNVATYAFSRVDPTYTVMKVLDAKVAYQTTYQPLELMSPEEASRTYIGTTSTDVPRYYSAEAHALTLYPTPNTTYTTVVRTVISEPQLAGSQSPLMPVAFHGSIISAGLVLYYETLQDTARLQAAGQRFDSWIKRMEVYARETRGTPRVRYR